MQSSLMRNRSHCQWADQTNRNLNAKAEESCAGELPQGVANEQIVSATQEPSRTVRVALSDHRRNDSILAERRIERVREWSMLDHPARFLPTHSSSVDPTKLSGLMTRFADALVPTGQCCREEREATTAGKTSRSVYIPDMVHAWSFRSGGRATGAGSTYNSSRSLPLGRFLPGGLHHELSADRR